MDDRTNEAAERLQKCELNNAWDTDKCKSYKTSKEFFVTDLSTLAHAYLKIRREFETYPDQSHENKLYKYWTCVCGCQVNFQDKNTCLRCKRKRIFILVKPKEK